MREPRKRRIDDAGKKIGGARKDWARERMSATDIDEMTDAERVENIQKDNVWPKPDYAALVDAGMARDAAALVKIIRDRIAKTPAVSRKRLHAETLQWYFETLSEVGRRLEACRTLDEVVAVSASIEEDIGRRSDRDYWRTNGMARVHVITRGRYGPLNYTNDDRIRIESLLGQGFPGEIDPWIRGHDIKRYQTSDGYYIVRGRTIVKDGLASQDEAVSWLKETWQAARGSGAKADKKIPHRPHLSHIERSNLSDRRDGEDVTPQQFIDVFGFAGVQFGEWLPDDERQLVLNHGYDALMDLSEVTGFAPGQLSLGGELSIAFGARGNGGPGAAHYEAGRRIVNMTRITGSGLLAHEWGHALDHYLGFGSMVPMEVPSLSGWRTRLGDCRKVLGHHDAELVDRAQSVLSAIYFRPKTKAEAVDEAASNIAAFESSVASYETAIADHYRIMGERKREPNQAWLRKTQKGLKRMQQGLEFWTRALASASDKDEAADFGTTGSSYFSEASAISGADGYWARPNELFARAFESFVEDDLKDRAAKSNYLVAYTDNAFYPEEFYKGQPYPDGEERSRLSARFASLMAECALLVNDCSATPPLVDYTERAARDHAGRCP